MAAHWPPGSVNPMHRVGRQSDVPNAARWAHRPVTEYALATNPRAFRL